ncbi:hypothetical protein AURDEDRAFT_187644 [Auricularia subglabra TFB-10046 SS5]|nr:hypothetical protein AURDEDRAFT_187644 [Auricularia subglabra TFB-10046 SS5]
MSPPAQALPTGASPALLYDRVSPSTRTCIPSTRALAPNRPNACPHPLPHSFVRHPFCLKPTIVLWRAIMVTFTPLLQSPRPSSESELAPYPSPTPVSQIARDCALYPFVLIDGEVFVHPCADLDEWYASFNGDAASCDGDGEARTAGEMPVREDRAFDGGGAVLRPPGPPPLAASVACALPPTPCDLVDHSFFDIRERAEDTDGGDDSGSLSDLTWSGDSVLSDRPSTDDDLSTSCSTGGPIYDPGGDPQADATPLDIFTAAWPVLKAPPAVPFPNLANYEMLISSILSAAADCDQLL